MASAAEQLASNFNFKIFSKAKELKKRIGFTLAALIVYRLGTFIPLPGISPQAMDELTRNSAGGVLGMLNMFSGGALGRMSIFALNIIPYISASIIVQLMSAVYPPFEALRKEGETGRKKLNQYTRYLTVFLAAIQAYALAAGLESHGAVLIPGLFFRIATVIIIVGATLFLMWLGEQITARGIGNGVSLIIFAGIVANLPQAALSMVEIGREGHSLMVFLVLIFMVAVIGFIVFMERAQRKILIQYPKQQKASGGMQSQTNHLPLKLNNAGVIPPIFASSILLLPASIGQFAAGGGPEWMQSIMFYLGHGRPLYILLFSLFIVFFCYFYTSLMFNPEETAENLKKSSGFIPGVRPGQHTAHFLDTVLTRLTAIGAVYLVLVCIMPEVLQYKYTLPFYFGGTSVLIVVSVTMDTVAQVHSHLLAHQYEGLLKKASLRRGGRRR